MLRRILSGINHRFVSFYKNNFAWHKDFKVVKIKSSLDGAIQNTYFYKPNTTDKINLIVSLHAWASNYKQNDSYIAELAIQNGCAYIHPDFRGANNNPMACVSEYAISDIEDAITYAKSVCNIDEIHIVGGSGGGHATFAMFMRSNHKIKSFNAWCGISDLQEWYKERVANNDMSHAKEILKSTNSIKEINIDEAIKRSPLYWNTPIDKLNYSKLNIYAGYSDNVVNYNQSVNFFEKVVKDIGGKTNILYNHKVICGREVIFSKQSGNVKLVVFDGKHEMLPVEITI